MEEVQKLKTLRSEKESSKLYCRNFKYARDIKGYI